MTRYILSGALFGFVYVVIGTMTGTFATRGDPVFAVLTPVLLCALAGAIVGLIRKMVPVRHTAAMQRTRPTVAKLAIWIMAGAATLCAWAGLWPLVVMIGGMAVILAFAAESEIKAGR